MKRKTLALIISLSSVGALCLGAFGFVYFSFLHHYKGKKVTNNWSKDQVFDISQIQTIQKEKGKDFTILNLADIQICDLEDFFDAERMHKEIDYLIEKSKPDLITLTGDQTWSNENLYSIKRIIRWLEAHKIPYAPVFGNHDFGNEGHDTTATPNYLCDLYERAEHCLFQRGPTNIDSLGNYVFNIMEGDSLYKTIYMVDAGVNDEFTEGQMDYFRWLSKGIHSPSAMAFMHKPIQEFSKAFRNYLEGEENNVGDVYRYYSLSGMWGDEFFEFAKDANIEHIIAGHQHGNCFSLEYDDVWLTASLKTGEYGGTIDDDGVYLNGATAFHLSDKGECAGVTFEPIFVAKGQF